MTNPTNEAMGHIIMWKGKRVSHKEYSDEMGSHVAPDVDLSKNFKYVLKSAMSNWKSSSYGITRFKPIITPMWRSWDREDGRRDKYEIGYNYQNDEGDTEYVFVCCVKLIKHEDYDRLIDGKEPEIKFFSSKKDTKPIEDPKDSSNPLIPSVNYLVKKHWAKYGDTIDSTQVNNSLQAYVERNYFVKQLDSRVYWMHSKDSEDWSLLAKHLGDMGIVIRDFPPSSSPESMKSLFEVVREDFVSIQETLKELNSLEQSQAVINRRKEIGEKWRAEVGLLKPLLSEMDEFNKLVESVEQSARQAEYESKVTNDADVFSDIEI